MKQVAKIMKLLDRHLDGEYLSWNQYQKLIKMLMAESHNNENKLNLKIKELNQRVANLRMEINANNN